MSQLYFNEIDVDDGCSYKDYWLHYMEYRGLKEMTLLKARVDQSVKGDFFYCKEYFEIGEVGEVCGKQCDGYSPRNGKGGICKHHSFCMEPYGEPILLSKE